MGKVSSDVFNKKINSYVKKVTQSVFGKYTVLFILMSLVVFGAFIVSGRSFIWNLDGAGQHYPILKKFHSTVWEVIQTGRLSGNWDFTVGLGSDMYNTFSYYVLGDPFTYLSLLFPLKYLEIAYHLMIILRLYLVGLVFILYARRFKTTDLSLLAGSMTYLFCGYITTVAARHPMFITPMIVMPMIFIGIENIREKKSPKVFILGVALALVSNFYFAYVLALIAAIYWTLRYLTTQKSFVGFLRETSKLVGYSLVSLLLSGVILVPIMFAVFSASRLSGEFAAGMLLYSPQHYVLLPKTLITTSGINQVYWTSGGYSSLILLVFPFIYRRRKEYPAICLSLIIGGTMILFPFFGALFNALSSPSNRWTFALAFPIGLSVMFFFHRVKEFDKKDLRNAVIFSCIWLLLINYKAYWDQLVIPVLVLISSLLVVYWYVIKSKEQESRRGPVLLLLLLLINIGFVQNYYYLADNAKYLNERLPFGTIDQTINHAFEGVEQQLPKAPVSRLAMASDYPNEKKKMNMGMVLDRMMIESYFTLQSNSTYQLAQELRIFGSRPSLPLAHGDDRTGVLRGLGVRYLLKNQDSLGKIPVGYKLNSRLSQGDTQVFETDMIKPFMGVATKLMLSKDYENLSPLDKERAFGTYTIVDSLPEGQTVAPFKKGEQLIMTIGKDQALKFSSKEEKITIPLTNHDVSQTSELYLRIKGLRFDPEQEISGMQGLLNKLTVPENRMSAQDVGAFGLTAAAGTAKATIEGGLNSSLSGGENTSDYLINLGVQSEPVSALTLMSTVAGDFEFDSFEVLQQPFDDKVNQEYTDLQKNALENIEVKTSYAKGQVKLETPDFITTLIPFSKGWETYVDGRKVPTIQVNQAFTGAYLDKGNHIVEFKYHTPGLKLGSVCTLVGLLLFLLVYRHEKRLAPKEG